MSIVSKPATKAYASNWNRIFKKKWGVVVGLPTKAHAYAKEASILAQVGIWCSTYEIMGNPILFDTRSQAREEAKKRAKENRFWHFHAKKYDGHA